MIRERLPQLTAGDARRHTNMHKSLFAVVVLITSFSTQSAMACQAHMGLDASNMGFMSRTAARMVGMLPPPPVFELHHPNMVMATVGEETGVSVEYTRPFFSKDVTLTVTGSKNIVLEQEQWVLDERTGTLDIPYTLNGKGYDTILVTVAGEHQGKAVKESRRIYVRPRSEPASVVAQAE